MGSIATPDDVRAGTRSQSSAPGPPAATEAEVHSSARVTSGSSQSLTVYPYVMFSIVPAAVKNAVRKDSMTRRTGHTISVKHAIGKGRQA